MTILTKPLRRQLETAIKPAREIAEDAAKEAIARIGVAEAEAPAHLSDANKALRRRLRAHARTLGDTRDTAGAMTTTQLQDAASYEIWHRMLFGRFLAERGLLIHPEFGAAMSVAELRDLAKEEGAADEWALAERYAAPGLPGVFKPDDPVLALPIAPEFSNRLRAVLSGLPEEVFTADDSLGWTYQFWRASEKDAVNAAGGKIGAAELPAVTQLFTESYMVKFLLHNTLGAWWAGKILALDPGLAHYATDEGALREACALPGVRWEFLRFVRDNEGVGLWRPAAGTFSGWPIRAAEITYCDPCCGSGHFLVEAFFIIAALRQREEGLLAANTAVAVLRDNLHGLELDGRCVQIAAFNVALAAWKLAGAPISLPSPHIAWVGAPPPMSRAEMAALADGDGSLCRALEALHDQFVQAPLLGSLLEIGARDLLDADLRERGDAALAKLRSAEPERAEGAVAARGLLDAALLLGRRYVLQATNVPFLGRVNQNQSIANHLESYFEQGKADLATAMLQKMTSSMSSGGVVAAVSPNNWLFLKRFEGLRRQLLNRYELRLVASLGSRAFESISGEVVNASLTVFCKSNSITNHQISGLDASDQPGPQEKSAFISGSKIFEFTQESIFANPSSSIIVSERQDAPLLSSIAISYQGASTLDIERFRLYFWEPRYSSDWNPHQSTPTGKGDYTGFEFVSASREAGTPFMKEAAALKAEGRLGGAFSGRHAWGRVGVACAWMGDLPASIYSGAVFDNSAAVILPHDPKDTLPIWCFCSSPWFLIEVRKVNKKIQVANSTLAQVPFDLAHWQAVAAERYPAGLPEPYSDDPTQWLFHGHPAFAEPGTELHVALARIAGYRWPAEADPKMLLSHLARERIAQAATLPTVDAEDLLPLHARGAKPSLADGLRAILAGSFGAALLPAQEQALVRAADVKLEKKEARDATLETWLRDRAFRQHYILFNQRPFLWQVWDGVQDGFSAFLHYHRLDNAALNTLTYTLLGDWIRTAKAEGNTARQERAEQLQQKLAKIIEGESPYDIFVRWKPLARQPIGWNPDLDDGVRLNIRPFMTAGILREQPKGIAWTKGRGTDVTSAPWYDIGPCYGGKPGDRINDHHTTLAEKLSARANG